MKLGFYGVVAGLLLAIVRGWIWLNERVRRPGERPLACQLLLGLLGLSISMADLDFGIAFADRARATKREIDTPAANPDHIGYQAVRAAQSRQPGSAKARPRKSEARPRRRSAFRAENPHRLRRVR